jgi:hypothetical protein
VSFNFVGASMINARRKEKKVIAGCMTGAELVDYFHAAESFFRI